MTQILSRIPTGFVIMLLVIYGVWPNISVQATERSEKSDAIITTMVPKNVFLRAKIDPTDKIWRKVPEKSFQLTLAPAVHQSIALGQKNMERPAPIPLSVSVISDGLRIYFHLRWQDDSKNDLNMIDKYRDGAAVQFPLKRIPTSPVMGETKAPVGIWYWQADSNTAEALTAIGPGTLTKAQDSSLRGTGVHKIESNTDEGEWVVVISQSLHGKGENRVSLTKHRTIPIAFAIWQGNVGQRDGYKLVSQWMELNLDQLVVQK